MSLLSLRLVVGTRVGGACQRQLLRRSNHKDSLVRRFSLNNPNGGSAAKLQAYLDGWVGTNNNPNRSNHQDYNNNASSAALPNNPVLRARAAMSRGPLLLSSQSYLLPTLRLERNETPQSLAQRLQQASPNNHNIGTTPIDSNRSWCCPIILDIGALAPDGSPHYQAPPPGTLAEIVNILSDYHFQVTGITSSSPLAASSLLEEVNELGLASLWSPRSSSNNGSHSAAPSFDVTQVLQLVQQKQQQQKQYTAAAEEEVSVDLVENAESKLEKSNQPQEIQTTDDKNASKTSKQNATAQHKSTEQHNDNKQHEEEEEEITLSSSAASPSIPTPVVEFSSTSTLYHGSVRSGQQVMSAKGQSLVILGSVNSGGEVLSDGDIFVFGKLRGRAFAGLGNTGGTGKGSAHEDDTSSSATLETSSSSARIVATSFDAE